MIAFTTVGPPSTSPQPVMPASVLIFTSSASWQLLVRCWISGRLKYSASTLVIFIVFSFGDQDCTR